jgi:hypothetical protein
MRKKNHEDTEVVQKCASLKKSLSRLIGYFIRDDPDVLEFLKWLYLIPLLSIFLNTKTDYHEL